DRLGAARLVDADRADAAIVLAQDIAADPADVVGHLLVADGFRAPGRLFQLGPVAPSAAAQDHVSVHRGPFRIRSSPNSPPRGLATDRPSLRTVTGVAMAGLLAGRRAGRDR